MTDGSPCGPGALHEQSYRSWVVVGRRNRRERRASRGLIPALPRRRQLMSALRHESTSTGIQRLRLKLQVGRHPERRLGDPGWGMAGETGNCKRSSTLESAKGRRMLESGWARPAEGTIRAQVHHHQLVTKVLGLSRLITNGLSRVMAYDCLWLSCYQLSAAFA